MEAFYELAILGRPSDSQLVNVQECVSQAVQHFGLRLSEEIGWHVNPAAFKPKQQTSTAVVYFGGDAGITSGLPYLLRNSVPILPVVSDFSKVSEIIPTLLRPFNCLDYSAGGAQRVATALLECVGLLPRQRRVFVSYRRSEARQAALQLFDALSARLFDVFLDTHGIPPAEDFQAMLWHRLCDSDVLIMLDTFDENVEGFSYFWDKSCVDEAAVHPDDSKDLTFFCVISGKPFLTKGLRKFKHTRS